MIQENKRDYLHSQKKYYFGHIIDICEIPFLYLFFSSNCIFCLDSSGIDNFAFSFLEQFVLLLHRVNNKGFSEFR